MAVRISRLQAWLQRLRRATYDEHAAFLRMRLLLNADPTADHKLAARSCGTVPAALVLVWAGMVWPPPAAPACPARSLQGVSSSDLVPFERSPHYQQPELALRSFARSAFSFCTLRPVSPAVFTQHIFKPRVSVPCMHPLHFASLPLPPTFPGPAQHFLPWPQVAGDKQYA